MPGDAEKYMYQAPSTYWMSGAQIQPLSAPLDGATNALAVAAVPSPWRVVARRSSTRL
nr:hypothetical protein GCM10020092_059700 [Actinoplanes digitatis]